MTKIRWIATVVAICMVVLLFQYIPVLHASAATEGSIKSGVTGVYFRETPGGTPIKDSNGNTIYLNGGQALTIQDTSNSSWYKVTLTYNGGSYTGYERVSASTGLPTVLGWYVHEWLWRNNVPDLNEKSADIQTIYTSTDAETVKKLISRYDISYIFVGGQEKEKYGTELNDRVLQSLGSSVFEDDMSGTYIVKVEQD